MEFYVSVTAKGTVSYPMHRHSHYEIMYYLEGDGSMRTESGDIPFKKGTIIIMPPGIEHGSLSRSGFVNISIGGDFSHLFMFSSPFSIADSSDGEALTLAQLVLKNRYGSEEYLLALCTAFAKLILKNIECVSPINQKISGIIAKIERNYADAAFNVTNLLKESGYAEDYIRAEFKKRIGKTPVEMLTKIRIENAKNLLDIYSQTMSIGQIAVACGFEDATYFSKKFKSLCGVSPNEYRKNNAKI